MSSEILVDNAMVRVTRWTLQTKAETGIHRHEYAYVVVPLSHGQMLTCPTDGPEKFQELTRGTAYYREAGSQHNVRNASDGVLSFVGVEVKIDQHGLGPQPG
jgi:quercetin dioxygenase-like cupin family protein